MSFRRFTLPVDNPHLRNYSFYYKKIEKIEFQIDNPQKLFLGILLFHLTNNVNFAFK